MPSAVDQLSTLARPRASRAGAQEGEAAAQGVPSSHRRRWHWRMGRRVHGEGACSCTTPRASTCVYASGSGASRRRNLCHIRRRPDGEAHFGVKGVRSSSSSSSLQRCALFVGECEDDEETFDGGFCEPLQSVLTRAWQRRRCCWFSLWFLAGFT